MTISSKNESASQKVGTHREQRKSASGSGETSTGSGKASPQKTTTEGTGQSETDRDKLLDEVNLPVPVPPGNRDSRQSSAARHDAGAHSKKSRKRVGRQHPVSKPLQEESDEE